MRAMMRRLETLLLMPLLVAAPAHADVPGQVNFQGLLLDSGGQPVTATVDLTFSLFATDTGGTSLWTESHGGVPVLDGVYDVPLGSTTPLTSVVQSSATLYLEIEVDGETLAPRQRLLAVPFAIRAAETDNVGGVSATFVSQIFQHVDYDGGDPPNDDPSEGVADVDGDGLANFIDPDNDGDGFSDTTELGNGTDINLVTPSLTDLSPTLASNFATTRVTITGTNFLPGLSVAFGSESPTPLDLTSTSFQVDVGPQAVGTVNVTVTNPNGETALGLPFLFRGAVVFITSTNSTGNIGGVAAADATCDSLASAAGLTGSFKAWISDPSTSPSTRFVQSSQTYTLVDGTPIAAGWADLTDGSIDNEIDLNETGAPQLGSNAWTDTNPDGTGKAADHCNLWSDGTSGFSGGRGSAGQTGAGWTDATTHACNGVARLYCFEQVP